MSVLVRILNCTVSAIYTYSLSGFYTATAPKETCSAQLIMNEECDEEMNMYCQTQELEKENHIERLKGIDVMHVCCMAGSIGSCNLNLLVSNNIVYLLHIIHHYQTAHL